MELREIAERILFATSLEEKLHCPKDITDAFPGSALSAPAVPGRPPELQFKTNDRRQADFPGIHPPESATEKRPCD